MADLLAPHRNAVAKPQAARGSLETPASTEESEEDGEAMVLPSSTELFYFYGQSLDQCSKLATGKGQALFDLCAVCKKWLRVYAGESLSYL
jgi:hypothetical protein